MLELRACTTSVANTAQVLLVVLKLFILYLLLVMIYMSISICSHYKEEVFTKGKGI